MNAEFAASTPLPTSPARGEVPTEYLDLTEPQSPTCTLPLAGRVGEGVSDEHSARGLSA
jgi:hypothetical protein